MIIIIRSTVDRIVRVGRITWRCSSQFIDIADTVTVIIKIILISDTVTVCVSFTCISYAVTIFICICFVFNAVVICIGILIGTVTVYIRVSSIIDAVTVCICVGVVWIKLIKQSVIILIIDSIAYNDFIGNIPCRISRFDFHITACLWCI